MRMDQELGPPLSLAENALEQQSSTCKAPETSFAEDSFSADQGWGGWFWDDSSILHLCALYFYYCSISSTLDHQALDSGGWEPLLWSIWSHKGLCTFPATLAPSSTITQRKLYIYKYTHIDILPLSTSFTKKNLSLKFSQNFYSERKRN